MNITLSPELKRFVEAKIGNGRRTRHGEQALHATPFGEPPKPTREPRVLPSNCNLQALFFAGVIGGHA